MNKKLVGARGFEPPAFCSQSRRATGLRHAPRYPAAVYRLSLTRSAFDIVPSMKTEDSKSERTLDMSCLWTSPIYWAKALYRSKRFG